MAPKTTTQYNQEWLQLLKEFQNLDTDQKRVAWWARHAGRLLLVMAGPDGDLKIDAKSPEFVKLFGPVRLTHSRRRPPQPLNKLSVYSEEPR